MCCNLWAHLRVSVVCAILEERGFNRGTTGVCLKRPLIREDLAVIHYQSQEVDNTFIASDGTTPYTSTRKWAVKRHYHEDNN